MSKLVTTRSKSVSSKNKKMLGKVIIYGIIEIKVSKETGHRENVKCQCSLHRFGGLINRVEKNSNGLHLVEEHNMDYISDRRAAIKI